MAKKIDHVDLQFSYFRLVHQKVSEDPRGVMVMHIPSGNCVMFDKHDSLIENRQEAIKQLYAKMGVPFEEWEKSKNCHVCGHQLIPALTGWTVDYSYKMKMNDVELQVYELEGDDDTWWYWEGTSSDELTTQEGDHYETAAGAAWAAVEWAKSLAVVKEEEPKEEVEEPADDKKHK